jgi:hypothetical protein
MGKIGRRNSLLLGMISEGVGYLLLGFGGYIDHKPTYIGLVIIARIISGLRKACVIAVVESIELNF